MKIILFDCYVAEPMQRYLSKILEELKKTHNVKYYSSDNDGILINTDKIIDTELDYLIQAKSFKMFTKVLDYCEQNSIDVLHITNLFFPEYLLSELSVRKKIKTKITFGLWGMHDIYRSNARANVYLDLLNRDEVFSMLLFTIGANLIDFPYTVKKNYKFQQKKIKRKIHVINEPFYHIPNNRVSMKNELNNLIGTIKSDFTLLFFGTMFFNKGVDILEKAIQLIIAGNPETINYEYSIEKLSKNPKINFHGRFIEDKDVRDFFLASDLVVLPYRKTFEYCSSGVFLLSMYYNKPVLCPNITPFKEIINRYKVGSCFEVENAFSLGETATNMKMNYNNIIESARFDDYKNSIPDWSEYSKLIIG
jgi:glycosyltransferase involved in cell wall biosynthesis